MFSYFEVRQRNIKVLRQREGRKTFMQICNEKGCVRITRPSASLSQSTFSHVINIRGAQPTTRPQNIHVSDFRDR